MRIHLSVMLCASLISFAPAQTVAQGTAPPVAVYYFPGWSGELKKWRETHGWDSIKKYPERRPLLGWYNESDPDVINQQADWMVSYGIDYVVFDWYWSADQKPFNTHAVDAFVHRPVKTPGFAFAWANHNDNIRRRDQFVNMMNVILDNYATNAKYWTIDGKPVIFVVNGQKFVATEKKCCERGAFIQAANVLAKSRGFSGLYFIAGMPATKYWVEQGVAVGFSAFSAYNIRRPMVVREDESVKAPTSYGELVSGYSRIWAWMVTQPVDYLVPVSAGWDKRPWGGSARSAEDLARPASPADFGRHLRDAVGFAKAHRSTRAVVICCWNEFGEGTYIEPTEGDGFGYLNEVRKALN